ncbi:MAG: ABC transporter ATP-binding protein, partial [Pseudobutyrivibrio sp.]|nr:ABC transporter ATP-binding protein [Pseudobutyrivibrio sp.]
GECPTYVVEGMCISGIMAIIAVRLTSGADPTELIAVLAAIAVGAFRVLPYLGKVSVEITAITQAMPRVEAVYNDILATEEYNRLHPEVDFNLIEDIKEVGTDDNFKDSLELRDVVFAYSSGDGNHNNILNGVSLNIKKGESIAFIGPSGAGKSTLVDVLLGLLSPGQGGVFMDGANICEVPDLWAKTIGYVPQAVFMCDDTIRRNVAFGELESEIDDTRVREALERAELGAFIDSLPEGMNTTVGDRGTRLSGGQRQRIAIARALYHRPEILVLDEATSALDNDTESAIMSAVESLHGQVTMIIVAHRLTTVKNCDRIFEVNAGKITEKTKEEVFG